MNIAKRTATFIEQANDKVIVAGYGSLLSEYSRQTYSNIMGVTIDAVVHGWERAWITRSMPEKQTYVGALPNRSHSLNAQLICLSFDASFEAREKDYRFTEISSAQLELEHAYQSNKHLLDVLANTPIYICETLQKWPANESFPVNYSYVQTCLMGCYESGGMARVIEFIQRTSLWLSGNIYNDLADPKYPRASQLRDTPWDIQHLIDKHARS